MVLFSDLSFGRVNLARLYVCLHPGSRLSTPTKKINVLLHVIITSTSNNSFQPPYNYTPLRDYQEPCETCESRTPDAEVGIGDKISGSAGGCAGRCAGGCTGRCAGGCAVLGNVTGDAGAARDVGHQEGNWDVGEATHPEHWAGPQAKHLQAVPLS